MKGKLTISRPSHGTGKEIISIELKDNTSLITFLSLEMSLSSFSKAITGLSYQPCEFELNNIDLVGKYHQHKRELVKVPIDAPYDDEDSIRESVSKFEIDGWRGRDRDAKNHHNWVRDDGDYSYYSVTYTRYVDKLPKYKIISNKIKCLKCGDIIESKTVHDFKYCKCGSAFVDGGLDYLRRGGDIEYIEDLSEQEEIIE